MTKQGIIKDINGPIVTITLPGVANGEQVKIGELGLYGEVISLQGSEALVQIYESTEMVRPGEPVEGLSHPLSVELGPGLMGGIFDGVQRPLEKMFLQAGDQIPRGLSPDALDRESQWTFTPTESLEPNTQVSGGIQLGSVQETESVLHRILVPPDVSGELIEIAPEGDYSLDQTIARVKTADGKIRRLQLFHRWPVRQPRPYLHRDHSSDPLITGQRILDTFFPLLKGGKGAVPGPFGAGKTMVQHQVARWSNADIVIYVGCGERGNELVDVLDSFPKLKDPYTGRSLMERTLLVANTSNMPVVAREASIYVGITIAEYYRDQGHDVVMLADSTSRWAEALREVSGRLGQMPVEEGYPAYLASRLSAFYERAGRVETHDCGKGSVSLIGAVSPPGGDFSEPVTSHTKEIIQTFWALSKELADARHYPAIDWVDSFSADVSTAATWWHEQVDRDWEKRRGQALGMLARDAELSRIVNLVGPEALSSAQRWILEGAALIKEGVLQQSALDPVDTFSSPEKQFLLLDTLLTIYDQGADLIELGVPVQELRDLPILAKLRRCKEVYDSDQLDQLRVFREQAIKSFESIRSEYAQRGGADIMSAKEYRTVSSARGGLLTVSRVPGIAFGDRVEIRDSQGRRRNGQVIRSSGIEVLIQVFEGTDHLDLENTWVRFLDTPLEISLSPEILGRVFDGLGNQDGRPPVVSRLHRGINANAFNPAARTYPREFIQTGISTIDGLNSLVRGQKLPIFSASGLPHNRLAAQIVRQAKLPDEESRFSIVFAAMGVSYSDARFFQEEFASSGVLGNVVMFINMADDPPVERLTLPRMALTAAEYLAFDLDRHVLVVMTDMTHYAEALREVATAKGDVPARKGYPGYLYSDLAEIYERSGRIKDRHGSITLVPVLSMPSDDITHPIPDLTGYITEGQIVLSRELHNQGVYPPVHISPSLSRLMKDGIGKDFTREDHPHVSNQLYALYARALETRNLASIIGADELSARDQRYLEFADAFEKRFVAQDEDEDRSIVETLNLAWELLSLLPTTALTRVTETEMAKYHRHAGSELQQPEQKEPLGMTAQLIKAPPTKNTLLNLKRQLRFLDEGHSLLERKRELLTRLVYSRLTEYRKLRAQAHGAIKLAYHWLSLAQLRMGNRALLQAALGIEPVLEMKILPRRNLGVEFPSVTAKLRPLKPVGLLGTDPSFDETRLHFAETALLLAKLGEAEMSLGRLISEQRKAQKRVNALKYNIIPRYKNTIRFIENSLEEEERNTLFQVKILREQQRI